MCLYIFHLSLPNSFLNLLCTSRSASLTVGFCLASVLSKSALVLGGSWICKSLIPRDTNMKIQGGHRVYKNITKNKLYLKRKKIKESAYVNERENQHQTWINAIEWDILFFLLLSSTITPSQAFPSFQFSLILFSIN